MPRDPSPLSRTPVDHPFPDLPETRAGHWIDVVADADGLQIGEPDGIHASSCPRTGRADRVVNGTSCCPPASGPRDAPRRARLAGPPACRRRSSASAGATLDRGRSHSAPDRLLAQPTSPTIARLPERADLSLLLNGRQAMRAATGIIGQPARRRPVRQVRPFESETSQQPRGCAGLENSSAPTARTTAALSYGGDEREEETGRRFYEDLRPPRDRRRPPARHRSMSAPTERQRLEQAAAGGRRRAARAGSAIQIVQAGGAQAPVPMAPRLRHPLRNDRGAASGAPCPFLDRSWTQVHPPHSASGTAARTKAHHDLNCRVPVRLLGASPTGSRCRRPSTMATLGPCTRSPQGRVRASGRGRPEPRASTREHSPRTDLAIALPTAVGTLERCDSKQTIPRAALSIGRAGSSSTP